MSHISHVSHSPRVRHKIFPYVIAFTFSLLSSLNYDPTYAVLWVSSLDFGLGLDNID